MNRTNYNDNGIVDVYCNPCPVCNKSETVKMPLVAYQKWTINGMHIQRAWPEADPSTRELLITGTHSACWDKLFEEDEEGEV